MYTTATEKEINNLLNTALSNVNFSDPDIEWQIEQELTKLKFGKTMQELAFGSELTATAIGAGILNKKADIRIQSATSEELFKVFDEKTALKLSETVYSSTELAREQAQLLLKENLQKYNGYMSTLDTLSEELGKVNSSKAPKYIRNLQSASEIWNGSKNKKLINDVLAGAEAEVAKLQKDREYKKLLKREIKELKARIKAGENIDLARLANNSIRAKINSNMERLILTENTNTLELTRHAERMQDSVVSCVKFTLSSSHSKVDQCDWWAGVDQYGLGSGVFPKDKAPSMPIHPNGRSFLVSVSINKVSQKAAELAKPISNAAKALQMDNYNLYNSQRNSILENKPMEVIKVDKEALKKLYL